MSWLTAEKKVEEIAKQNGDLPIYWGIGYPVRHPHVLAYEKDCWSGEGQGYNVVVYPDGDDGLSGLGIKCKASSKKRFSVSI